MEGYEEYREAGIVARDALKHGIKNIKEGKSYLELAEEIEEFIKNRANIAFPVNISVNSTAAHYTPAKNDELVFLKGDVVKIDVGAHVNGYIGDTAKTVEVGTKKYEKLIESAERALEEAIKIAKDGVRVSDIGRKIEEIIKSYGFKPVKNLQGHSLEKYNLHAGLSIPNFDNASQKKLKAGQVVAIEPFATNGAGIVVDAGIGNIYRIAKNSPFLRQLKKKFSTLPFAERWLYEIYGDKTKTKLTFLLRRGLITPYYRLVDMQGGIVAQAEHTLLIKEDGCEILTL